MDCLPPPGHQVFCRNRRHAKRVLALPEPREEFGKLQILSVDIWLRTSLYDFLPERMIIRPVAAGRPGFPRPVVRILAPVSNSRLHSLEKLDQALARELHLAFHNARQRWLSELVKILPVLREIRVMTSPRLEFDALQRQNFREPGIGD